MDKLKPGVTYYATHTPSSERWLVLGFTDKEVCAAGWPATIGKLEDMTEFEEAEPLTEKEKEYVTKTFGSQFLKQ